MTAEIAEPMRGPLVIAEPRRYAPLRSFSCGRQGRPWENAVNVWARDLYRGLENDQTVLVLEDAHYKLIGLCSFKHQPVIGGVSVGKRGQRIHMIGIDRLYRGKRLSDGTRPSDILLAEALRQINLLCDGRMPAVSTLVSPGNDPSHALFARHGFRQLPYRGEGEIIRLRPPDKRLSLARLYLARAGR